jgi:hypothetical protein
VLFAGTERALFVTHDSGAHWSRLTANLPTTRYDDILVHPRTKDLVLGTHGRGIWILDDASPIAAWTPAISSKRSHLFPVPTTTLMVYWEDVSNMDHYFFTAENPAEGATFTYSLAQPAQKVKLVVTGPSGKTIREVTGPGEAGVIHRVNWDLRFAVPPGVGRGGGGGEEGGGGNFGPGTEKPGTGRAAGTVARLSGRADHMCARHVQGRARRRRHDCPSRGTFEVRAIPDPRHHPHAAQSARRRSRSKSWICSRRSRHWRPISASAAGGDRATRQRHVSSDSSSD